MNPGIHLRILSFDDDSVMLQVIAASNTYRAQAILYVDPSFADIIQNTLSGFPNGIPDRREVSLGTFDPNFAGGGARFEFTRVDEAGHCIIWADIYSDAAHSTIGGGIFSYDATKAPSKASFPIMVEASAIDEFLNHLRGATPAVGDFASLQGRAA
jgi:hypothetical protein